MRRRLATLASSYKAGRAPEGAVGNKAVLGGNGGDLPATATYGLRPRAPLTRLNPGTCGRMRAGFASGGRLRRTEENRC